MPFVLFALALELVSQSPLPQAAPGSGTSVEGPTHRVDFSEVDVRGALQQPTGALVWSRPKGHRRNLIALRANFRPELTSSTCALAPGTR